MELDQPTSQPVPAARVSAENRISDTLTALDRAEGIIAALMARLDPPLTGIDLPSLEVELGPRVTIRCGETTHRVELRTNTMGS